MYIVHITRRCQFQRERMICTSDGRGKPASKKKRQIQSRVSYHTYIAASSSCVLCGAIEKTWAQQNVTGKAVSNNEKKNTFLPFPISGVFPTSRFSTDANANTRKLDDWLYRGAAVCNAEMLINRKEIKLEVASTPTRLLLSLQVPTFCCYTTFVCGWGKSGGKGERCISIYGSTPVALCICMGQTAGGRQNKKISSDFIFFVTAGCNSILPVPTSRPALVYSKYISLLRLSGIGAYSQSHTEGFFLFLRPHVPFSAGTHHSFTDQSYRQQGSS